MKQASTSGVSMRDAAFLSKNIYNASRDDIGKTFGGWKLVNIYSPGGLKMGVYGRLNSDGQMEYTVANKGTSTGGDWLQNFGQPLGLSNDAKRSIDFAVNFDNYNSNKSVTFTGHSKAGAEALLNGLKTNRDVITFNPARANPSAYGINAKNYSDKANATAYAVKGDILTGIEGTNKAYNVVPLDTAARPDIKWYDGAAIAIYKIIDAGVQNHYMESVIK